MEQILIMPIFVSLLLTLYALPKWIKKAKKIGLVGKDRNRYNSYEVAESGGIVIVMSFMAGVLFYIAIKTFILETNSITAYIFALLTTIALATIIGLVDDLFSTVHGGLSNKLRIFLVLIVAIPLMVINAGTSTINFPFLGPTNIGILYPLILIPLGIVGATTTYNFLAGFNGLEAGQGIIILSFLSFIAYLTGSSWLAIVGLCMVASLVVFYFYNSYPAKVFPGDVLTYSIGALIAGMAILGNFERIAVFVFIPYIIETVLKVRGKLKKESFAKVNENGSLEVPYNKIYGLTHLSIWILKKFKKKVYEIDVVYFIFLFQVVVCLLALIVFRGGLFLT